MRTRPRRPRAIRPATSAVGARHVSGGASRVSRGPRTIRPVAFFTWHKVYSHDADLSMQLAGSQTSSRKSDLEPEVRPRAGSQTSSRKSDLEPEVRPRAGSQTSSRKSDLEVGVIAHDHRPVAREQGLRHRDDRERGLDVASGPDSPARDRDRDVLLALEVPASQSTTNLGNLTAGIHIHPTAPLAARVLLPGDPGRALLLAQALLDEPRMFNHNRGLWGGRSLGATPAPPAASRA